MGKVTIAILLLMITAALVIGNNTGIFGSKPALKLVVKTGLDNNGTVKVTNMTFEQTTVPFFYRRADVPAKYPDINAYVRYDTINSEPKSYWSSVYRTDDEGLYTLILTFRNGKEPKLNDTLIISTKVTNFNGDIESKSTAFYGWK